MIGYLIAIFPTGAPHWMFFATVCATGLLLGLLAVLLIGGADMPAMVISLLNSYAGLAACATGFALQSNILIIAGALDGSSGFLLSIIMSKRDEIRSFANVVLRRQAASARGSRAHARGRRRSSAGLQRGDGRATPRRS